MISQNEYEVVSYPRLNHVMIGFTHLLHRNPHLHNELELCLVLSGEVTVHLQDKHYGGAEKLGHGVGYLYAHDFPEHYVKQQYLPDELVGRTFYHPSENGYEKQIGERLRRLRSREE